MDGMGKNPGGAMEKARPYKKALLGSSSAWLPLYMGVVGWDALIGRPEERVTLAWFSCGQRGFQSKQSYSKCPRSPKEEAGVPTKHILTQDVEMTGGQNRII